MKTLIMTGAVLLTSVALRAEMSTVYNSDFKYVGTIITVNDPPEPQHTYDWSGLSRLDFENGHPVAHVDAPAMPDLKSALPEPKENIIDALDEIRKHQ